MRKEIEMKQDYLILCRDVQYHLYITPDKNLCIAQKEDREYRLKKCLLKEAYNDFSVAVIQNGIHIVCQDLHGSIWYFSFYDEKWNKRKLLESREKRAYFKNLSLITVGDYVNLLYVIETKDGRCLAHQIVNGKNSVPAVVDYCSSSHFSVCTHTTSVFTVLYQNAEQEIGTKKYRWSQKTFDAFCPLDCGCDLKNAVLLSDRNDNLLICGFAAFDKFENILFLEKSEQTKECVLSAVHLVSGVCEGLTLSVFHGVRTISWCENGLVMTATEDQNKKWTAPKKYMKASSQENIRVTLVMEDAVVTTFGIVQNGTPLLYHGKDFFCDSKKNQNNAICRNSAKAPVEYVHRTAYNSDMEALKKLLAGQNDVIAELLNKIAVLERFAAKAEAEASRRSIGEQGFKN